MRKMSFALMLVMLLAICSGCGIGLKVQQPAISLDGCDIVVREDLQKALDKGLVVRDAETGETMTEYPTYGPRQLWYQEYEMATLADPESTDPMAAVQTIPSGVYVELCNTLRVESSAVDCKVAKIRWDLYDDATGAQITQQPVLLRDIDFRGMTADQVQQAMKEVLKLSPTADSTAQKQIYEQDIYRYTIEFAPDASGAVTVSQVTAEWVIDTAQS